MSRLYTQGAQYLDKGDAPLYLYQYETVLYCTTVILCLVFMSLANRLEKIVYLLYSRTCLLSDKGSFLFARAYNRVKKFRLFLHALQIRNL